MSFLVQDFLLEWRPSLLKHVFVQVDDDPGAFGRLDVTGAPLLVTLSRSHLSKIRYHFQDSPSPTLGP